jgi:hypothetical protein
VIRKPVLRMLHKDDTDVQEWKTVYEDELRKIQARENERRAIEASTGKVITEYSFAATTTMTV